MQQDPGLFVLVFWQCWARTVREKKRVRYVNVPCIACSLFVFWSKSIREKGMKLLPFIICNLSPFTSSYFFYLLLFIIFLFVLGKDD